jgi:hypothetical protein
MQDGAPPVTSWFINPMKTIVISAINHSVKPLIRWSWGPHPAGARWTTRKHNETNSKSWEKPGTKKLPTKPGLKHEGHRAKPLHLTKSGDYCRDQCHWARYKVSRQKHMCSVEVLVTSNPCIVWHPKMETVGNLWRTIARPSMSREIALTSF